MSSTFFWNASRELPTIGSKHLRRIQPNQSFRINLWRRFQHDDTGFIIQPVPQKVNLTQRNAIAEEISDREIKSVKMTEPDELKKAPAPAGSLSIVFTDIVKSTAIWETDVSAMAEAMTMHDNIIRKLCKEHSGYEVKQNGDGFMFAFPTATSAIQFCLDTQAQLLDAKWPKELLKLQPGRQAEDDDGHVLFRGLRLRMSAHWGTPVCKWNSIIKRMDYLGPMVNRAARFIEVTEAGQIVVSEDFLIELQRSNLPDGDQSKSTPQDGESNAVDGEKENHLSTAELESLQTPKLQESLIHQEFEVRLLGQYNFKGLSEPEKLYSMVPKTLRGRLDVWPKHSHISGSKGESYSKQQLTDLDGSFSHQMDLTGHSGDRIMALQTGGWVAMLMLIDEKPIL